MKVSLIPAFEDNYLFAVEENGTVMIVDPGSAREVLAHLQKHSLKLERILITHHHGDHIGGVLELSRETGAEIYGPSSMPKYGITPTRVLGDGDTFAFHTLDFRTLAVPGHTLDHLAYFEVNRHALFCGDTLFSLGCGRLFEGTFPQMFSSLAKLRRLPSDTAVYCAHEYTLNNLKFERKYLQDLGAPKDVQQKFSELFQRVSLLREKGIPTVPSTLAFESDYNLFFNAATLEEFTRVREARNRY